MILKLDNQELITLHKTLHPKNHRYLRQYYKDYGCNFNEFLSIYCVLFEKIDDLYQNIVENKNENPEQI